MTFRARLTAVIRITLVKDWWVRCKEWDGGEGKQTGSRV